MKTTSAPGLAMTGCGYATAEKSPPNAKKPNILLITTDDMDSGSANVFGCKLPGVTPNLDRLASEGMRFENAYVNVAVCQPCRKSLIAGLHPHRNGSIGFMPIDNSVTTIGECLHKEGYYNVIMGKEKHYAPLEKYAWDRVVAYKDLIYGRDPEKFQTYSREVFAEAKRLDKPFFVHMNTSDPHRPFAGSEQEKQEVAKLRAEFGKHIPDYPPAIRTFSPDEVEVPGWLPDLPDIRKEVAQYFATLHRGDHSIGLVLKALQEAGLAENTIVIHLGDNGMAVPFDKVGCYPQSNKTALIIRWPGKVKPGTVDSEHMVCNIDIMPTLLAAAGAEAVEGIDGKSFLPVLKGSPQKCRDKIFTSYNYIRPGLQIYPMRGVQDRQFAYIYNAWSDGKMVYNNEPLSGLTFEAMKRAGLNDAGIAERVKLCQYRVPEEFYDLRKDPNCLNNLIDNPAYSEQIKTYKAELEKEMIKTNDPLLPKFRGEGPIPPIWYVRKGW